MDPNDPRRRLQIMQNSSPSIRLAAAPAKTLNIGQVKTPNITAVRDASFNGNVNMPAPVQTEHQRTPWENALRNVDNFTAGANENFLGAAPKAFVSLANYLGSGLNAAEADKRTNDFLRTTGQTNKDGLYNNTVQGMDRQTNAFQAGQVAGSGEKLATDIASMVIPGAAVEKGATSLLAAKNILQGTDKLSRISRVGIPLVAGSATSSAIQQAQDPTQNAGGNVAGNLALDTGAALLGPVGSAISRTKVGSKIAGFLGNATKEVKALFSPNDTFVTNIIKSEDPTAIKTALGVDDNIAGYLANESNPETVKEVLKQLAVDPNIKLSDEVRQRLEAEGITAVNQKDTPYGAEYNPNDSSINVKDQSFATDANMFHELGHHIYTNKLTPEEKQLFANVNGPARAQATGRAGYTTDDLISEDFSDMLKKAMTGRIDEVPESLRGVVAKYANIAPEELANVKMLPAVTDTTKSLPKTVGKGFVMADKGTQGLPALAKKINSIDQQLSDVQMGKKASTREEIAALNKEKNDLIAKAQAPFDYNALDGKTAPEALAQQEAKAIEKTQTGTSESTSQFSPEYEQRLQELKKRADYYTEPADSEVYRGHNAHNEKSAHPDRPVYYSEDPNYAATYGDKVTKEPMKGRVFNVKGTNSYQHLSDMLGNVIKLDSEWATGGRERFLAERYLDNTLHGESLGAVYDAPMPEIVKRAFDRLGITHIRNDGKLYTGHSGAAGHQTEIIAVPKPSSETSPALKTASPEDASTTFVSKADEQVGSTPKAVKTAENGLEANSTPKAESYSVESVNPDGSKPGENYTVNFPNENDITAYRGAKQKANQDGSGYVSGKSNITVADEDGNIVKSIPYDEAVSRYGTTDRGELSHMLANGGAPKGKVERVGGEPTAAGGIKFRDPETKKQVLRSYEDVQAELDSTKNRIAGLEQELNNPQSDSRFVRERIKNERVAAKKLEEKLAKYRSENAKYSFPDADAETQKAIQDVMDQLSPAERQYNKAEKLRSQEKAGRIAKGAGTFDAAGGGEAGVRAKLGALKGKYSESTFNPINASEATQTNLLNDIEKSGLRDFEKLNTQNALRKVWGATEGKPTKSDIGYIRKYFGDDMADAVDEAVTEGGKNWRDKLTDFAGIPRAAMASFDFSMGLRQGGQVAVRNFPEWVNANKESAKYAFNKNYFESEMKKLADDDAYELITSKLGVRLPASTGSSDEVMASANILEKIPVYGRGIEGSDRAYSGGLTKLRYNIAKKVIDSFGGIDEFVKKFSDKEMKDIGEVINTSTGSGGKPGGFTEKHMHTLATTLFAPRLWASRLNAVNPAYYARLSPTARKMALQNIGSFLGVAGAVVGMAAAAGADVELDPRSSDFMKPKIGNTRYDVMGGLQQNIVFLARMISGEKKNSSTGEIQTLGDGFGQPNRFDLAVDMGSNKLNPLLGYAVRQLQSTDDPNSDNPLARLDRFGQPMNAGIEAGKLAVPLGVQGVIDTAIDTGNFAKSVAMNAPSFVGVGVQTYGNTKSKDQGTDSNGKVSFKGAVTEDMVTGPDGQPLLNDKGQPVKVTFPKDATDLEKKAILANKRDSALAADFTGKQSKEDQALMKLTDDQLKGYVKDGTISQDRLDSIKRLQKGAQTNGRSIDVPDGITSDQAKSFYQKYNTMTEKDQKYWLDEPASENSKAITAALNGQRAKGLSEYKPSNQLAKAYSEYEKDINTHPEYTDIDKRNKAKAFQTFAYKLNYSTEQKDIYAEGGSDDLKTLINDKSISQEDLNEAIKMDNELYAAGLVGSLKFSKKFRNSYGFATPASKDGSGGGSGGSGGSKRAYLSAYVSNGSSKSTPAPTFSAKRRTQGVSFKDVSTPKKSNSKKVTINL